MKEVRIVKRNFALALGGNWHCLIKLMEDLYKKFEGEIGI